MMKKNGMAWTIVLTLMMASMAGCLGGDAEEEIEEKTINIAGSSTVFPVASAWVSLFTRCKFNERNEGTKDYFLKK